MIAQRDLTDFQRATLDAILRLIVKAKEQSERKVPVEKSA